MKALTAAMIGAALFVGGCATTSDRPGGGTLAGRSIRMQTANGQTSTLSFARDGTVRAAFGERQLAGRYEVDEGRLCFFWGSAPRECWPYSAPYPRGETIRLTSDRGNVVNVTML